MTAYGYARVSTRDQNVNRQLDALTAFPLEAGNIYVDYYTGASFDRPEWIRLMQMLGQGDILVVKSIDRLGRSYREILEQWRSLTGPAQVDIVVLDMPLLDTRTSEGSLTGAFISDIVLQLLSYVAQVERENIHQRQAEGIAAARARGKHLGRPELKRPESYLRVTAEVDAGRLTLSAAARKLGVSRNTLYKWRRQDQERIANEN